MTFVIHSDLVEATLSSVRRGQQGRNGRQRELHRIAEEDASSRSQ